jgi:hypothetical protein
MSISDRIASIQNTLNEIVEDASKTDKGNKAAGTRVRKALQTIANDCKEIRKEVTALKNADNN